MTNKEAIKEIVNLRDSYYSLNEEYFSNCSHKEAKEITDGICVKITALDVALVAMEHIETIRRKRK